MSDLFQLIEKHPFEVILFLSAAKLILLAWVIWIEWELHVLKKRLKLFFGGKQAADLEDVMAREIKKVNGLEGAVADLYAKGEGTESMARAGLQKVGFVRFNAFKDAGGEQSFALALLDHENNGAVMSSLFGREGTRVYTKQIKAGVSEHSLSEEEEKAIREAMGK